MVPADRAATIVDFAVKGDSVAANAVTFGTAGAAEEYLTEPECLHSGAAKVPISATD